MRHCTHACFANPQALCWCVAPLMGLLSCICKDTAILVFWKDLPWKPNNESRKLNRKASTATASSHIPCTHSPWRWWLCSLLPPTFTFVRCQDNQPTTRLQQRLSQQALKAHSLEKARLADLNCFLYHPNWCAWLENISGKNYEQTSPPTSYL